MVQSKAKAKLEIPDKNNYKKLPKKLFDDISYTEDLRRILKQGPRLGYSLWQC